MHQIILCFFSDGGGNNMAADVLDMGDEGEGWGDSDLVLEEGMSFTLAFALKVSSFLHK